MVPLPPLVQVGEYIKPYAKPSFEARAVGFGTREMSGTSFHLWGIRLPSYSSGSQFHCIRPSFSSFNPRRRRLHSTCYKAVAAEKNRVMVISGPTSAGNSRMALELAKRLNGEIISSDSVQVRGALETLLGALTPLNYAKAPKNDVQPATMNADLMSRETDSISLLLSLLAEDDFYIRYYTLQLLTSLLNNSASRLQEVILATPRGITRLMDMLLDREVIRNEALLLLTFLTREAEIATTMSDVKWFKQNLVYIRSKESKNVKVY